VITWEWDAAARRTPVAGVIASADRRLVRHLIEQWMRQSGAQSALAREVQLDPDWDDREPTGDAMIAQAADWKAREIAWRYVSHPAQPGVTAPH
jgi:hypothetical protein